MSDGPRDGEWKCAGQRCIDCRRETLDYDTQGRCQRCRAEQAERENASLRLQIARLQGQLAYIRDAIMAEDIPQLSRYGWLRRWAEGDAPSPPCPNCAALRRQVERMRQALLGVQAIMDGSRGVDGWHLNGDIAAWDEFEERAEVDAALSATPAPPDSDNTP